ncbi:MAG: DUF1854 domain-containing protein [Gemmatimonadetes bacterium]|nr:DUF1854 domain-containing protein [Gemmatimonadota bacterium]
MIKERGRDARGGVDPQLTLEESRDGRLWLCRPGGRTPVSARPCFPWSAPERHVSLRDEEGQELAMVEDPSVLDGASQAALETALGKAGFLLRVTRIRDVDDEVEIRHWKVDTEQGPRSFQTALDIWPREMPGGGFVVEDVAGDLYYVDRPGSLDRKSRQFLWAYAE